MMMIMIRIIITIHTCTYKHSFGDQAFIHSFDDQVKHFGFLEFGDQACLVGYGDCFFWNKHLISVF